MVGASAALAFDSGDNPGATGANHIEWTGQGALGGKLDSTQCDAANDPNGANQPYLYWVLTPDGGSVQVDSTTPILHLGGSGHGDYINAGGDAATGPHAVKFITPYYTPDSGLTASAEMNVTDTGHGSWNLVISHGCAGVVSPPVAKALGIDKTAAGTFDTAYQWGIAKAVDQNKINTPGDATANYTVTVTHDNGTNGNYQVSGKIDVKDPNNAPVAITGLTDTPSGGTAQSISGPATLQPGDNYFDYSLSLGDNPPSGQLTNTATVTWANQTLSDGSLLQGDNASFTTDPIQFAQGKVTDSSVSVTDSLGSSLGTVSASDSSPKNFTYPIVFKGDPAGTCTTHDNTATFTTDSTGTTGSASQSVKVCVGADLQVKKDANPSFDRTYLWNINKTGDKSTIDPGGKVNYKVTTSQSGFQDGNYQVKGTVTVTNPNDWEDVTLNSTQGLVDSIDNGGVCTFDNGDPSGTTIPSGKSVDFAYTCTYSQAPSALKGTNTATASWDAAAASTPDGSANGSKDATFGDPTNRTNQTIHVTDSQGGALGDVTATDSAPFASKDFNYSKTFAPPASGCATINNTATITETGQNASFAVKNCNSAALTMGFWQNKNGQTIITGANQTALASYLKGYAPFADYPQKSGQTVAQYFTSVFNAANASGTGAPMLKAQMLATALDVYFSDSSLGGNKISAPAPIGGLTVDTTAWKTAFNGQTSLTVSQMLLFENGVYGNGGTTWYGGNKTLVTTAITAFNAINNQQVTGA